MDSNLASQTIDWNPLPSVAIFLAAGSKAIYLCSGPHFRRGLGHA
jgi:hypothetical protein